MNHFFMNHTKYSLQTNSKHGNVSSPQSPSPCSHFTAQTLNSLHNRHLSASLLLSTLPTLQIPLRQPHNLPPSIRHLTPQHRTRMRPQIPPIIPHRLIRQLINIQIQVPILPNRRAIRPLLRILHARHLHLHARRSRQQNRRKGISIHWPQFTSFATKHYLERHPFRQQQQHRLDQRAGAVHYSKERATPRNTLGRGHRPANCNE